VTKKIRSQVRSTLTVLDHLAANALSAFAEFFPTKLKSAPLVSVIIATYNRPRNLEIAIESVLRQTYQNFEILVVGDGCTDDTKQAVKGIKDDRVRWLALKENSGSQSLPNNLGLAQARGTYIAYLGHDDVWLPNHLSALMRSMEKSSLDVATTRCFSIGPPGSNALILSGPRLIERQGFTPPSALCHRSDIVKLSGNWIDYKKLPPNYPPDVEFIDRLNSASARKRSLRQVGVIKLNAAWRKDFYQSEGALEQAHWLQRSRRPHRLVFFLLAKASLWAVLPPQIKLPTDGVSLRTGEHLVDAWRRVKGLPER
jgi:glycosyltransferase involved in cell wall biosynthesis